MMLRTSSTRSKSDVHLALLSENNFDCLICLKAACLFPDLNEANANFLELQEL